MVYLLVIRYVKTETFANQLECVELKFTMRSYVFIIPISLIGAAFIFFSLTKDYDVYFDISEEDQKEQEKQLQANELAYFSTDAVKAQGGLIDNLSPTKQLADSLHQTPLYLQQQPEQVGLITPNQQLSNSQKWQDILQTGKYANLGSLEQLRQSLQLPRSPTHDLQQQQQF